MVFSLSTLSWRRTRGLWKLPDGRDWMRGKLGLVPMGGAVLSKPLIQFSVDGQGCVPSLLSDLRPWIAACQASLSLTNSRSFSNSCPSHRWSHPTISSSAVPFSACLQSFPASGSFPVSQFFTLGGQSTSPQNWVMVKGAPLCKFPHSKLYSYSRRILWNVNLIKLLKSRFEAVKRKTKSLWKPLNVHTHTHKHCSYMYEGLTHPFNIIFSLPHSRLSF